MHKEANSGSTTNYNNYYILKKRQDDEHRQMSHAFATNSPAIDCCQFEWQSAKFFESPLFVKRGVSQADSKSSGVCALITWWMHNSLWKCDKGARTCQIPRHNRRGRPLCRQYGWCRITAGVWKAVLQVQFLRRIIILEACSLLRSHVDQSCRSKKWLDKNQTRRPSEI